MGIVYSILTAGDKRKASTMTVSDVDPSDNVPPTKKPRFNRSFVKEQASNARGILLCSKLFDRNGNPYSNSRSDIPFEAIKELVNQGDAEKICANKKKKTPQKIRLSDTAVKMFILDNNVI